MDQDWDDGTPQAPPAKLTAAELFTAGTLLLLTGLSISVLAVLPGTTRLMAGVAVLACGAAAVQLAISVRLRRECEHLRAAGQRSESHG